MRRILRIATLLGGSAFCFASPAQAATVTIGPRGEFQVDGQPFLPIMQWLQSSSRIAYQKDLGINTFVGNGGNSTSAEYLVECQAQGVWCVMDPADLSVSGDPALLGWIFGDEPDLDSNAVEPEDLQAQYDSIKQVDSNHVTLLTVTSGFFSQMDPPDWMSGDRSRYYDYAKASDAIGFDLYPVYGWCRPDWLHYVGASQEELAVEYASGRATYQWIECVRTSSQWCDLEERDPDDGPTATEVRNEVWQAIVHGAKAIGYFTHSWECPDYTQFCLSAEQEAELTRTNAQLTALTVPILSPPYEETVTVAPSSTARIDWTTRRVGDEVMLIAVNGEMSAVEVTFEVPGLAPDSEISVHDEDRTVTPAGETFTDSFEPLAVHIYDIAVDAGAGAGGAGNTTTGGSSSAGSPGANTGGRELGGTGGTEVTGGSSPTGTAGAEATDEPTPGGAGARATNEPTPGGAGAGATDEPTPGGAGARATNEPSTAAGAPSTAVDEPSNTGGARSTATSGASSHADDTNASTAGAVGRATDAADGDDDDGCGCAVPRRANRARASLFAMLLLCALRPGRRSREQRA